MGFQARIVRRLPRGIRHYPLDVTFIALGAPSAVLTLIGVSRSASLTLFLPKWAMVVWSGALLVGCVAWGIGVFSAYLTEDRQVVIKRVPSMILGLYLVSTTAFVYGLAIILLGGWSGTTAAFPLLAFAAGTYIRRINLSIRLHVDGDDDDGGS